MAGFGFGPGGGFASGPSYPGAASSAQSGPAYPQSPPAECPPTPPPRECRRNAVLIDGFYGDLPPGEVLFVHRDARVPFASTARIDDTSGDILRLTVPAAQTLVVTGVEFYADGPDSAGAPPLPDGSLRGSLAFAFTFDDRVPLDSYTAIDAPGATPDPTGVVRGSFFSSTGQALGGPAETRHFALRAREGTVVRAAYAVLRAPATPPGHVGAIVRGFMVPTAVFDKQAP